MSGLNNIKLFLTILEAGKSEIKVPTDSVSGEAHFLACRQLPSRSALRCQGESALVSLPLLIKTLIPLQGPHPHDPSKPKHIPKAPPPNTITMEGRASIYEFGVGVGDTNIQSITDGKLRSREVMWEPEAGHHGPSPWFC